jgi:hypothetical protein
MQILFEKFEPYFKGLALISAFMGFLTLPLSFIATVKQKQEKVRQNEQLCDTIIINNDSVNNIKFR